MRSRLVLVARADDDDRSSTPQRALVILTSLLVVAALALVALRGLGGDDSTGRRRVTAAPGRRPTTTAPSTTAPATTVPGTDLPAGSAGGAAVPDGSSPPEPSPTTVPTAPSAVEDEAPPVPAEPAEPGSQTAGAPGSVPAPTGPAPVTWYVTFRGGDPDDTGKVNDVLAYDREGKPIPTPILGPGPTGLPLALRGLRAMAFGSDGTLFVVNGDEGDSKVLAFGGVGPDGTRPLLGEYAHGFPPDPLNPGIQHPYGLALDGAGNLLVASQHSQVVTRLFGPNAAPPDVPGTPTATASSWCPSAPCQYYPGTFAPATHPAGDPIPAPPAVGSKEGGLKSPRAVVFVSGNHTVYVADNADASVKAYDATTGSFTGPGKGRVITGADGLSAPVGMTVHNGVLYVADERANAVFGLDLITPGAKAQEVVPTTVDDVTLDRPSGVAFDPDGALYVASRGNRQVARYELSSDGLEGETANVLLGDLPDQPEQILAVPG
jgi:hypothetical protein